MTIRKSILTHPFDAYLARLWKLQMIVLQRARSSNTILPGLRRFINPETNGIFFQ